MYGNVPTNNGQQKNCSSMSTCIAAAVFHAHPLYEVPDFGFQMTAFCCVHIFWPLFYSIHNPPPQKTCLRPTFNGNTYCMEQQGNAYGPSLQQLKYTLLVPFSVKCTLAVVVCH